MMMQVSAGLGEIYLRVRYIGETLGGTSYHVMYNEWTSGWSPPGLLDPCGFCPCREKLDYAGQRCRFIGFRVCREGSADFGVPSVVK